MSNERIDLTALYANIEKNEGLEGMEEFDLVCAELKRCYQIMNEVILRALDARSEEASDIIKHGDIEYIHVDEITYPFLESDIDAALDSKASE